MVFESVQEMTDALKPAAAVIDGDRDQRVGRAAGRSSSTGWRTRRRSAPTPR